MNRDDIIRMAREAGFPFNKYGLLTADDEGEIDADAMLERFAALVAAAEREACAKLCDSERSEAYAAEALFQPRGNPLLLRIAEGAARCAAAIRARG